MAKNRRLGEQRGPRLSRTIEARHQASGHFPSGRRSEQSGSDASQNAVRASVQVGEDTARWTTSEWPNILGLADSVRRCVHRSEFSNRTFLRYMTSESFPPIAKCERELQRATRVSAYRRRSADRVLLRSGSRSSARRVSETGRRVTDVVVLLDHDIRPSYQTLPL